MINKNKFLLKKLISTSVLTWWLAFLFIGSPLVIQARTFDPNNIITDNELFNKGVLSKTAIQNFLERENSVLVRFGQVVNGVEKTAAEIIYEVSQEYNISPKFLLTTVEKEKGLISKSYATEKELDWATGYSCHSGRCDEKYRGFFDQVESSAITQNIYKEKAGQFGFQVGKTTKTFDGYQVTPQNQATANLYIYTPYVGNAPELGINSQFGANKLFWQIWNLYFADRKYPDGLVIKNNNNYWLIEKNKKRKFVSKEIFLKDYEDSEAIYVTQNTLNAYEDGAPIYFANNTLVKSNSTGQAFLIFDQTKRPIIEEAALATLADFYLAINSIAEIPVVDHDKLVDYPIGNPIDSNTIYPQGKLVKNEAGQIYLIKDGLKLPVEISVWQANYKSKTPEPVSQAEIEKYPTGSPVKFKDGTFIKSSNGNYYVISNGQKIKITSVEILKQVFGEPKFMAAIAVPNEILDLHESGLNITYIDETVSDSPLAQPINQNAGTYSAKLESMNPDGLMMLTGEIKNVTLIYKNTGSASWLLGEAWLEVEGVAGKINFNEGSVAPSQSATFSFNYKAPDKIGLNQQNFKLYYSQNSQTKELITFGKFVLVKSGTAAEIISHNIPVAVRNNWKPIQITMKIKNTSTETSWLARKTALKIYDKDGSESSFYDKNDWVRKEVAAVAVNKTYIKPGEVGEFKFTINPRGLKPGVYIMKFKLNLLDKDKQSLINGHEIWERQIRVD